jgi:hypothetical protein
MHTRTGVSSIAAVVLGITGSAAALAGESPAAAACRITGAGSDAGIRVAPAPGGAVLTWGGTGEQSLEADFRIIDRIPTLRKLSVADRSGRVRTLVRDAQADYEVVTGLRRISNQQLVPLRELGATLDQQTIDRYRWDPFWDAPLHSEPPRTDRGMSGNPPPVAGLPGTNQPGLPRREEEVQRARAAWDVKDCQVGIDGTRAVITFPGVTLGVFTGSLRYTVWRGSNLIRMEIVAQTQQPWVAYKYDAGLRGLSAQAGTERAWRDISGAGRDGRLGAGVHPDRVPRQAANRVIAAERAGDGAIAVFPPPHRFFWARELSTNREYNWVRRDTPEQFSLGIRQAESESEEEFAENWALYSARPGTEQLMPVFLYPDAGTAAEAISRVLAFTRNDRFATLPGFKVMNHHYHMDLGERLLESGSIATRLPDLVAIRATGIDIVSQIDSVSLGSRPMRANARPRDELAIRDASIKGAKLHSDRDFLVLANQEVYNSPIGGHTDLLFSHPVYWVSGKADEAYEGTDPRFGKFYRIRNADDLMNMVRTESAIISMPHPRTKGSTGFPDAIQDKPYFLDPAYHGVGVRWGMGLDGSERRTCELRCLPLIDDMSNWMSARGLPLKYMTSISEVRHQQPGDDIYASAPVTYVQLDSLPPPDDVTPLMKALAEGRSFVTTGEVLLHSLRLQGAGKQSELAAEVEWTFPLEFVELVWGDGKTTGRQIIPVTDLPPFGRHRFVIPFDARNKMWVRFAAWDSAYQGATSQPMRLK